MTDRSIVSSLDAAEKKNEEGHEARHRAVFLLSVRTYLASKWCSLWGARAGVRGVWLVLTIEELPVEPTGGQNSLLARCLRLLPPPRYRRHICRRQPHVNHRVCLNLGGLVSRPAIIHKQAMDGRMVDACRAADVLVNKPLSEALVPVVPEICSTFSAWVADTA